MVYNLGVCVLYSWRGGVITHHAAQLANTSWMGASRFPHSSDANSYVLRAGIRDLKQEKNMADRIQLPVGARNVGARK